MPSYNESIEATPEELLRARKQVIDAYDQKAPAINIQINIPLNRHNLAALSDAQLVVLYDLVVDILNERGVKF